MIYTDIEATRILDIYRNILPNIYGDLSIYFDYERKRKWSLLTTDFNNTDVISIKKFNDKASEYNLEILNKFPNVNKLPIEEQASISKIYRDMVVSYNIGFSLGVSPITDDLLLKTFNENTTRIIILLAHDWYPIITTAPDGTTPFLPIPPLQKYSVLSEVKYEPAVSPLLKAQNCGLLFMNLYPDFRAPGSNKIGNLGDYTIYVKGFLAICKLISSKYDISGVISWGSNVWNALKNITNGNKYNKGIMYVASELYRSQSPLFITIDNYNKIPYYPFAHPSFATNFKNKDHWASYQYVCSKLI